MKYLYIIKYEIYNGLKITYTLFYFLLICIVKIIKQKKIIDNNRILLVKIDAIGDNLLFIPYLNEFINKYKNKEITLITSNRNYDMYNSIFSKNKNFLIRIKYIDENKAKKNIIYFFKFLSLLNELNFNEVYQLRFNKTFIIDDLICFYLNTKKKLSITPGNFNTGNFLLKLSSNFYDNKINLQNESFSSYEYHKKTHDFYKQIGITSVNPFLNFGKLTNNNQLLIHTGGSDIRRTWGIEKFFELAKNLNNKFRIKLIIKKKDCTIKNLSNFHNIDIIFEEDISFNELIKLTVKSKLVISNETSISHLSSMLKVKNICIIGGGGYDILIPYKYNLEALNKYSYPIFYKMECFGCKWQCIKNLSIKNNYMCFSKVNIKLVQKCIFNIA